MRQIFIPKPCHENWNKMTPEEQGRHCAVCSKVVQDFSGMKNEEIVENLKDKPDGEVCGRINAKQITPTNSKQKFYFWIKGTVFKRTLYPLMAFIGITYFSKKASAQITDYSHVKGRMKVDPYRSSTKKLNVVVKDGHGNLLEGATIVIKYGTNTLQKYQTNQAGRVTINFDEDVLIDDKTILDVYAPGYDHKSVTVRLTKKSHTVVVKMEEEMMLMGEIKYIPDDDPPIDDLETRDSVEQVNVTQCEMSLIKIDPIDKRIIIGETKLDPIDDLSLDHHSGGNHNTSVTIDKFKVYPNPTTGIVNISTNYPEGFEVYVFDGNGKKLLSLTNINDGDRLDLDQYVAGTYFVVIRYDNTIETKKVVVLN